MKVYCENIETIPNIEKIIDLARQEHLVLEFPKAKINPKIESQLIAVLKEQLPENYSIFNSGIRKSTITITIISVISEITIKHHIEFIKQGIKDYLDISKILLNDSQLSKVREWELLEEHGEHNRYENIKTGQVLETCSYPITHLDSIDPYFFGLFIKTSMNHQELKEIINHEFHDSVKILKFIEQDEELKKQLTLYIKNR